jgi:cob(I)alamin adenosyltransferase
MALETDSEFKDYKTKPSVVVVYTGDSKGKTSASIGLLCRALGTDWRVAFVQFIKHWEVGEHKFFNKIIPVMGEQLVFYKGGKGFYNAGALSAKQVSIDDHKNAALETYKFALKSVKSGEFDLVICDEINNAVKDGLLTTKHLADLTGRNFPNELLPKTDIVTNMVKIKHHFDDMYLANPGIDY